MVLFCRSLSNSLQFALIENISHPRIAILSYVSGRVDIQATVILAGKS